MLQTSESESEILLGNKQLLGIFFVIVLLLGVAFAGGYKLGKASKKGSASTAPDTVASAPAPEPVGQTHDVAPNSASDQARPAPETSAAGPAQSAPEAKSSRVETRAEQPLGSPKHGKPMKSAEEASPATESSSPEPRGSFTPQPGQLFLQVAAVGRDEAEAVADVLHKKGFRAHAVPKPGSPKIYRVLIGPIKDAGDLSATRDSLRRTGFREVITQRY
jgi:cell division protein FtsN